MLTADRRPSAADSSAAVGLKKRRYACRTVKQTAPLTNLVDAMLASYENDTRAHHIDRRYLPSREEIIEILKLLMQLFYPGYFGRQGLTHDNIRYQTGVILELVREKLERQLELSLRYGTESELEGPPLSSQDLEECGTNAKCLAALFLKRLPDMRRVLIADVQAAYEGDPAAYNLDEVILAYPSVLAVTVYRIAHEFYGMGVPLMPRIMTEWAHAQTGADIHPGADIGGSFFIDHATGAVVGETTVIGAHVKLYQGVTLGARSLPRDERGRIIRGTKRHPTVEDRVTVYANATVLGGETTLGEGSVIGGSTFVTESVPAHAQVALKAPSQRVLHSPGTEES